MGNSYRKEVTINSMDMVLAEVFSEDGRQVAGRFFYGLTSWNWEAKLHFNRAHKWADERIKLCKKQETK